MNGADTSGDSKKLKCEDDQNGKTVELKVGTEQNQHIVSIKPGDDGKGSDFGLVYIQMRGGKDTI
jgi:ribosomal protein S6E (S10)